MAETQGIVYLNKTLASTAGCEYMGVKWEITNQSVENLTSTIKWELIYDNPNPSYWMCFRNLTVVIANKTVFRHNGLLTFEDGSSAMPSGSKGSIIVEHSKTTGKIDIYIGINAYCDNNPEHSSTSYAHVIGLTELRLNLPLMAVLKTAPNFNDEQNPTITYISASADKRPQVVEAAISLTGANDDIEYRAISSTGNTYTFELTEDERNVLRLAAINSSSINVRFYLRTSYGDVVNYDYLTRKFTVVNSNPIISDIVIKDIHPDIIALTGNEDTLVRYASMAEYSYTITAQKLASITEHSITNGSQKKTGLTQGIFDDVESGDFTIAATDSRGYQGTRTISKPIVNYIKPTCHQEVKAELVGETGAQIALTISGNYFNDTFGAVENTLKLEVRHTQNDGTMGEWVDLTDGLIPVFSGNTYSLSITISGFNYGDAYTFQCRATDRLNTVISSSYTVRALPVFDWSQEDFNFNVPVNVNANEFSMNGETVLRHTGSSTNNTVLSASGGHIYIRPGGTTNTSSEVRITAQGNIEVKGDIILNGVSLLDTLRNAGLI